MRADRLLSIVMLLQAHGRLTAADLAGRLEVSERTIYRDMDALSAAGIPIYAERGKHGGWELLEGYESDLTGLNIDEIRAVFLTNSQKLVADLGLEQANTSAMAKLLATLPEANRYSAERMQQRIHIDATSWRGDGEIVPCLETLQTALWHNQQVHIRYQRANLDTPKERILSPLGLVAKGNVWYLIALCNDDTRTYRASRIISAELLNTRFSRPEDFDLVDYWDASTAEFLANLPEYRVTLLIHEDADMLVQAWKWAHIEQIDEPDYEGWRRATVRFDVLEEAVACVLGGGTCIRVVEPNELRVNVIKEAQAVASMYVDA